MRKPTTKSGGIITFLVLLLILLLPQMVYAFSQATVFIYHRFADPRHPSTNISAQDFQNHLQLLQEEGFTVVTLGRVLEGFLGGDPLPARCAVISIDDAYRSFLTTAWPLLQRYNFPATLFVHTDSIGGGEFLSWDELRQLQKEGVEIGNHSASHAHLLQRLPGEGGLAWELRVVADIQRAQQALEDHLGQAPTLFAYPYGEYSAELADLVRRLGFKAAFGQQSGVVASTSERYALPRFPVGGDYSANADFRSRLFLKALAIEEVEPDNMYHAADNPPRLHFRLRQAGVDPATLRCFVPGQPDCKVSSVSEEAGTYEAVAVRPLAEQRSKYTLTASDRQGRVWFWYSHLWVREGR